MNVVICFFCTLWPYETISSTLIYMIANWFEIWMYILLVLLLLSTLSLCGLTHFTNTSTSDPNSELLCTLVLNMEQVNFGQSLKNIPTPDAKTYRESLIESLDKVIKSCRWKAKCFLKPFSKQNKETFGLKSIKSPEAIPELKNFENDLIHMAQNIEFRQYENNFI